MTISLKNGLSAYHDLVKKSKKIKNPQTSLSLIPIQNGTQIFFSKVLTDLELEMFTGNSPRGKQQNYFY